MHLSGRNKTLLLCLGLLVVGGGLTWFISIYFFPTPDPNAVVPKEYPVVPISSSPYLNVSAQAEYVGVAVCSECHTDEAQTYRQTAHRDAFSTLNLDDEPKGSSFTHSPSGREYDILRQNGKMVHRETLRDKAGDVLVRDAWEIRYLVGSGRHARTYLLEDDGFLLESPLTYYTSTGRWAMSPGYDSPHHKGFSRLVGTDCLSCHTGNLDAREQRFHNITVTEHAISCERCHGPGSLHVARHRNNPDWRGSEDLTIVHPDSLDRQRLEAICAQCHLQGEAMIYLRGRNYFDFRPSLPLTDFRIDYELREKNDQMTVVGHLEQMRASQCYQKSESMTCTTCHEMHRSPPEDKVAFYRDKCIRCHQPNECGLPEPDRLTKSPRDNCLQCHMPVSDTELPHIAFTHHRIGIHRDHPTHSTPTDPTLVPKQDVSHLPKIERDRCLGLAYLAYAEHSDTPPAIKAKLRTKSNEVLASVYNRGLHDGETLGALARLYYGHDDAQAIDLAQRALKDKRLSVDMAGYMRFLLADSLFKQREYTKVIELLEKLVTQRRLYEDWLLLGLCYRFTDSPKKARSAFEKAKSIQPYRPEVYRYLSEAYAQLDQPREAAEAEKKAAALEATQP